MVPGGLWSTTTCCPSSHAVCKRGVCWYDETLECLCQLAVVSEHNCGWKVLEGWQKLQGQFFIFRLPTLPLHSFVGSGTFLWIILILFLFCLWTNSVVLSSSNHGTLRGLHRIMPSWWRQSVCLSVCRRIFVNTVTQEQYITETFNLHHRFPLKTELRMWILEHLAVWIYIWK